MRRISRRSDPSCEEVRGWIPKEVARRFKAHCTRQGFDYSQGLEKALLFAIKHIEQWEE